MTKEYKPCDWIDKPQEFHETFSKEQMMEYAMEAKKNAKNKNRLTWYVEEIRGVCPLYKEGDVVCVIDSDNVDMINTELSSEKICYSFLDNFHFRMGWTKAKREDFDHLTIITGECRTTCSHPGPPYTPCGGVIFRMKREEVEE